MSQIIDLGAFRDVRDDLSHSVAMDVRAVTSGIASLIMEAANSPDGWRAVHDERSDLLIALTRLQLLVSALDSSGSMTTGKATI